MADSKSTGWNGAVGTATFDAVLVAATGTPSEATEAIALAGGRIAHTIDWTDSAASAIEEAATLVLDATGVADDVATNALARWDWALAGRGARLIVVIDERQIDVAAILIGDGAQLLCRPTRADWIAAFMLARAEPLSTSIREGEAARLTRLAEEIARIAEVLAQSHGEAQHAADGVGDRRLGFDPGMEGISTVTADAVRRAIRIRRTRERIFGSGLFEDPAWDMLLDLFAAQLERAQVSVSSLCIAAAVAPTTALRWIGKLTEAGLFERHADPIDRRRAFMALSPQALRGMHGYFATAREAGSGLA